MTSHPIHRFTLIALLVGIAFSTSAQAGSTKTPPSETARKDQGTETKAPPVPTDSAPPTVQPSNTGADDTYRAPASDRRFGATSPRASDEFSGTPEPGWFAASMRHPATTATLCVAMLVLILLVAYAIIAALDLKNRLEDIRESLGRAKRDLKELQERSVAVRSTLKRNDTPGISEQVDYLRMTTNQLDAALEAVDGRVQKIENHLRRVPGERGRFESTDQNRVPVNEQQQHNRSLIAAGQQSMREHPAAVARQAPEPPSPPQPYRTQPIASVELIDFAGDRVPQFWRNFFTAENGRYKGDIKRLESLARDKFKHLLVEVRKHPRNEMIGVVEVSQPSGQVEILGVPLHHVFHDLAGFFRSSQRSVLSGRVSDMTRAARLDPVTSDVVDEGEVVVDEQ